MNQVWQGWVAAILVAVVGGGGLVVWWFNDRAQRQEHERLRQESLYRGLIEGLTMLNSAGTGAGFVVESDRAWLYASDDVLRAVAEYRRELLPWVGRLDKLAKEDKQRLNRAVAKILLAMRKETYRNNRIGEGWAEKWPGIGSKAVEVERYLEQTRPTVR